ncbi:MAG: phosphoenolpyruvate--protein phosphotransferase [Chloroflexales bacterium]|nr:phosphoenolpyruvate--protein phosphotransferase [Chloroflexales bacterium]
MVSIVIVSHSAKLAEGVLELAQQMVQGQVQIAATGGIDDPENPIGTDPLKVHAAIESVYNEAGVLVLMDLGSALLSAEMALDFLDPEQRANVYLCAAPLVEGAMAAAIQASTGASLEQVRQEAQSALTAKIGQLQSDGAPETSSPDLSASAASSIVDIQLTVENPMGLHARPAANFVKTASRFQADIQVRTANNKTANAKSINQVATLGVRSGDQIVVQAAGPDAAEALAAIQALAADHFGEAPDAAIAQRAPITTKQPLAAKESELLGIPASPGVAVGPVFLYRPQVPEVVRKTVADGASEWARLQVALGAAHQEIEALQTAASSKVGAAEAAIFGVHRMFLQDPTLQDAARRLIFDTKLNVEAAWQQAIEAMADQFRALDDDYLRARVADVLDVGQRVLRHLMGVEAPALDFAESVILVARDLTPSDTARLNPNNVLGICTQYGGATSHSAILARALNIPAIVGLNRELEQLVSTGQQVALDGSSGQLWLQPSPEQVAQLTQKRQSWQQEQQQAKLAGQQPAITLDGHRVEVAANIGGPRDTALALEFGAEGVGLFRTEFLFMDRQSAPSEEEQFAAYQAVAQAMGQRSLIIRTLDIGGDKPLPYLNIVREDNPFLGWRGIRFCLDTPEIFNPQLRAILRASAGHNLKIMFPMISNLAELRAAKQMLGQVQDELRAEGVALDESLDVGIMIEAPAAVAIADRLAAEVDFFSIGSNDLTQYVMAADRGNSKIAKLVHAFQPAVLHLIKQTIAAAHRAGIWAGMCGELAGNALAAPLLLGLGLDEFSMSATNIPAVKAAIRRFTLEQTRQIADQALAQDSAEEVQRYLETL